MSLALLCTAFGYVLYFRLIETSGATNALLVTLLVPPVAILLGASFLGETLAPQDFIGLAPDRRRPGRDRRPGDYGFAGTPASASSLAASRAGPVEVADVAPYLLALGVVEDGGRQDGIGPERA